MVLLIANRWQLVFRHSRTRSIRKPAHSVWTFYAIAMGSSMFNNIFLLTSRISLVTSITIQEFGIGQGCGMRNEITTVKDNTNSQLEPCSMMRKFGPRAPNMCSINPVIVSESSAFPGLSYVASNTLVDGSNDVRGQNANYWIGDGFGSGFVIDLDCNFDLSVIKLRNAQNGHCDV